MIIKKWRPTIFSETMLFKWSSKWRPRLMFWEIPTYLNSNFLSGTQYQKFLCHFLNEFPKYWNNMQVAPNVTIYHQHICGQYYSSIIMKWRLTWSYVINNVCRFSIKFLISKILKCLFKWRSRWLFITCLFPAALICKKYQVASNENSKLYKFLSKWRPTWRYDTNMKSQN